MLNLCHLCQKPIEFGQKFCSRLCYHISTRGKYNKGHKNIKGKAFPKGKSGYNHLEKVRVCKLCNENFTKKAAYALYCSDACKERSRPDAQKKDFICKFCQIPFKRRAFNNACYFCSRDCSGFFQMVHSNVAYFYKAFSWLPHECEICKIDDYQVLCVHHRDKDRKNNEIKNLQILCANCHYRIHFGIGRERRIKITKIKNSQEKFNAFKKRNFEICNRS